MRIVQGVGGAMLLVNATAIITDAFPVNERGKAMGIAFTFSLVLFLLAAAASWMRGAMPPGPLDDDVGEALEETVLA